MPVLGSSAYAQIGTITIAVRAMLNDAAGSVFSDGALMPFFNLAYDAMWSELANNGDETFIEDEYFLIVPGISGGDPSAQVVISDTACVIQQAGGAVTFNNPAEAAPPNVLPGDMYRPVKLWERPAGSNFGFAEMSDRTSKGGLPAQMGAGTTCLGFFEWRSDGLAFLGAESDVQVKVRYQKMLLPTSDPTASIAVRNGLNFLTFQTAYLASKSKGSTRAAEWKADADENMEKMISAVVRTDQKPVRRRAHSQGNKRSAWI
jgi:hypothetical protein